MISPQFNGNIGQAQHRDSKYVYGQRQGSFVTAAPTAIGAPSIAIREEMETPE